MATFDSTNIEITAASGTSIYYGSMPLSPAVPDTQQLQVRWQVITVYLIYMIPISLLLRGLPFHMQYAYGLIAMCLLEFGGYLFESSYAYPDNLMDQYLNIRNFSLGMSLFFALYFPLGNALVGWVYKSIFKKHDL